MATNLNQHINNIPDPATRQAVRGIVQEFLAELSAFSTAFNAHTHNGNGAQAGSYFTSPPRSDTATVTAGTALAQSVSKTV